MSSSRKSLEANSRFSFPQWYHHPPPPSPSQLTPPRRNRALSIRSSNRSSTGTSTSSTPAPPATHHRFSLSSLRTSRPPSPSHRLHRLIKSTNLLIHAHTTAARERLSIATQLSEWGSTMDPALSDVSDKVGVVLSELGEQEDVYARALDEARGTLKTVRDTERSVAPVRAGRERVAEEIARVKMKEPGSARLVVLEQELVRAEAEGLVGEAQVGNVVSFVMACWGVGADVQNRRGRSSRRRTRPSFWRRLRGPRSRLSWRGMG